MDEIYKPVEDSYLLLEVLKKELPKLLKKNKGLKFLEIGCGSGIQLQTALDSGVKKENIFSCDINPKAVRHCSKLGFYCVGSNLFENTRGRYDLVIFNPPYLPEDSLEPKSSRTATTGGRKSGEIINRFLKQAKKYLNKKGKIFLLTSSLTKGIEWGGWGKKLLGKKKMFFEELRVWELTSNNI